MIVIGFKNMDKVFGIENCLIFCCSLTPTYGLGKFYIC